MDNKKTEKKELTPEELLQQARELVDNDKKIREEGFLQDLGVARKKWECSIEIKLLWIDGSPIPLFIEEQIKKTINIKAL